MQNFKETRLPVWMNDINEGLYQISINTINWKKGIPLKIENPILRRTEFWIMVIIAIIIFFFFIFNEKFQKIQLQEKITGLELNRLKSNMNPHFIFNVMNFVQAMIVKNNKTKALNATTKLSQLNRLFLETSEKEYISLKNELEFANTYIQLEKMRFESDKEFEYNVNIEQGINIENWNLPPLIMQPLLENAIKHGVLLEKKEMGVIRIYITSTSPNEIIIQIQNEGLSDEFERIKGTSRGQKMVIDRIELFNKIFKKTY
jgi:LytS/YehU family sensor histidine kinase